MTDETPKVKAEIYQSLYTVNESLQLVGEHLEKLKTAGILKESFAEIRKLAAEQMRAEINQAATINLHTRECESAHRFEKERSDLEVRVAGPES